MIRSNVLPRSVPVLVLLVLTVLVPGEAGAQGSGAGCDLAPVSLPLFGATPAAVIAATPSGGVDAPQLTEETMRAAAEQVVACANDNAQSVRYAIFTDRLLATQFAGGAAADQPAFERRIAVGTVPQEQVWQLDAVTEVELLPDGRVAATLHLSTDDETVVDRLVFAWDTDAGAWLIDEIVALDQPATPGA